MKGEMSRLFIKLNFLW